MSAALKLAAAAAAAFWLVHVTENATGHTHSAAVRYAEAQIGKPYQWGATGPGSFDCSGLAMMAERAAGISIPRTTFTQWVDLRHIPASQVKPGDLVYFAGGDGTMANPGHVGIVVRPATDLMIDAPQPGGFVEYDSYAGSTDLVGFADPGGH